MDSRVKRDHLIPGFQLELYVQHTYNVNVSVKTKGVFMLGRFGLIKISVFVLLVWFI